MWRLAGAFGRVSLGLAVGRLAAAASTPVKGGNAMSQPTDFFAYVGSRTTRERNARGEGINVYRVDAKTGAVDSCPTDHGPGQSVIPRLRSHAGGFFTQCMAT